jgi:amidase
MDELIYASARTLAKAIRAKQVSSQELVNAYLKRIESVNPQLNAVVQVGADAARDQARVADEALASGEIKGPLHGVPITVKDSLDTAGMISSGGTTGRRSFVPAQDATVVARMRAAGAIVLGKTNTPELTLSIETDNLIYGRTNNPYDVSRTPGGSSGGAAAIIAAGGSPLDLGSDTGGSIRQPAHFCGVAGIKPTSGRVPRTGHIISFDVGALEMFTQIGPIARFVEDLTLTLPIIAGMDWRDPAVAPVPLGDPAAVELKELRAAFYTDNGVVSPTPETVESVRAAVNSLADAGVPVEEDQPAEVQSAVGMWMELATADAGTSEIHPILETRFLNHKGIPSAEFSDLLTRWNWMRAGMTAFMEKYDVMICPVNAYPAMPHENAYDKADGWTYSRIYNLTGWPVAVVGARMWRWRSPSILRVSWVVGSGRRYRS